MKKTGFILALTALCATSALAFFYPYVWPDGRIREGYPSKIGAVQNATPETAAEAGYIPATQEQVEAQEAADAAEQAEADSEAAAYADPQPAVFVPRVADDITNVVGQSQVFVDASTGEVFALDETGSPEHTITQKSQQNAARKADRAAAKAAIEEAASNGKVNKRLDAIEAALKTLLK